MWIGFIKKYELIKDMAELLWKKLFKVINYEHKHNTIMKVFYNIIKLHLLKRLNYK